MERLDIDAPQAIAYLERVSHYSGLAVTTLATDVVLTRELPGISGDRLRCRPSRATN